eukprot:g346.t1
MGTTLTHLAHHQNNKNGYITEVELKAKIGALYDQKFVNDHAEIDETNHQKRVRISLVLKEAVKRKIVKQSDIDFRNLIRVATLKKKLDHYWDKLTEKHTELMDELMEMETPNKILSLKINSCTPSTSSSSSSNKEGQKNPDMKDQGKKYVTANVDYQQQSLEGGPVKDIDDLYRSAAIADTRYKEVIHEVIQDAKLKNTPYQVINTDTHKTSGHLLFARLKKRERAEAKATDDYTRYRPGPSCSWLNDIVRATYVCDTCRDVIQFVNAIRRHKEVEIVRMKNRFKHSLFHGYRDMLIHMKIQLNDKNSTSHVCEMQIHFREFLEIGAREKSHEAYEFFRAQFGGNIRARDDRLKYILAFAKENDETCDQIVSRLLSEENPNLVHMKSLATLMSKMNERGLEARLRIKIGEILKDLEGVESRSYLKNLNFLARVRFEQHRYYAARQLLWEILTINSRIHSFTYLKNSYMCNNLAMLTQKLGNENEAIILFKYALIVLQAHGRIDSIHGARQFANLAILLEKRSTNEAALIANRAVEICKREVRKAKEKVNLEKQKLKQANEEQREKERQERIELRESKERLRNRARSILEYANRAKNNSDDSKLSSKTSEVTVIAEEMEVKETKLVEGSGAQSILELLGWDVKLKRRHTRAVDTFSTIRQSPQSLKSKEKRNSMPLTLSRPSVSPVGRSSNSWQKNGILSPTSSTATATALPKIDAKSALFVPLEELAHCLINLSRVMLCQGRVEDADRLLKESVELRKHTYGRTHPKFAVGLDAYGDSQMRLGNFEVAENCYHRAIAIWQGSCSSSESDKNDTDSDNNIDNDNDRANRNTSGAEGEQMGHPDSISALKNLGLLHWYAKRPSQAGQCFERCIAICKSQKAMTHDDRETYAQAIDCLRRMNAQESSNLSWYWTSWRFPSEEIHAILETTEEPTGEEQYHQQHIVPEDDQEFRKYLSRPIVFDSTTVSYRYQDDTSTTKEK